MFDYSGLPELFSDLVPDYKGRSYRNMVARFKWDERHADFIATVSERRVASRMAAYIIPGELSPGRQSLRFGNVKTGSGYKGERKDFCLVGASLRGTALHVFYRRLELIGGLHFDLALFQAISRKVAPFKTVTIMTAQADVFAARGNSNEKLFQTLKAHYDQV